VSDRLRNFGGRFLISCWLIAIIGGFFVSVVMSINAFRNNAMPNALVFAAIAIGCGALCYRTYVSRDELRSNFDGTSPSG
jgi:ABC-type Fe3+-siderophore transport system permease subunit